MADVIGPNSYRPGMFLKPVKGMPCDDHPERESTHRMVGETDSFGSELIDMCQECYDKYIAFKTTPREKTCEWCKSITMDCEQTRDSEEGSYGRLYSVCKPCRDKQRQRDQEELDHYRDERGY